MLTTLSPTEPSAGAPRTGELAVVQIPPDAIERVLGLPMAGPGRTVAGGLVSIERRSNGELMAKDFFADAVQGKAQLWLVWGPHRGPQVRAIIGTFIETTGHKERQARIQFCTGEGAREWAGMVIAEIEEWARANRCVRLCLFARPGWSRLLKGFRVRHIELARDLRD